MQGHCLTLVRCYPPPPQHYLFVKWLELLCRRNNHYYKEEMNCPGAARQWPQSPTPASELLHADSPFWRSVSEAPGRPLGPAVCRPRPSVPAPRLSAPPSCCAQCPARPCWDSGQSSVKQPSALPSLFLFTLLGRWPLAYLPSTQSLSVHASGTLATRLPFLLPSLFLFTLLDAGH